MTLDEAINHCEEVAEEQQERAEKAAVIDILGGLDVKACKECAADHRQLAEWLTKLKELEAKHWDECRQIAHYDDDIKLLTLILKDRLDYAEEYGKKILDGTYSDSYTKNEGYCNALVDVLDIIGEVINREAR